MIRTNSKSLLGESQSPDRNENRKIRRNGMPSIRKFRGLALCSLVWAVLVIFRSDFPPKELVVQEEKPSSIQAFNATTTVEEIRALFQTWNDALAAGDPARVAQLYETENSSLSSSPVLLHPTLSNHPRTDRASLEEYFASFLNQRPEGKIVNGHVRISDDGSWAHDAGIYEFVLNPTNAPSRVLRARYSFLYIKDRRGQWKIAHHHSSLMPETAAND